MTRQEFKDKYLMDAFFWVDKENYLKLQDILNEFGIHCHTGIGLISWHEGFNNIQTFESDKWHSYDYYQKTDFWHSGASYGEAKDYAQMLIDYDKL